MIEADIFNKAVEGNIPKSLRNLYIKFDVNTLRHCGEMPCVEEYLHTFGDSDITTTGLATTLVSFDLQNHNADCGQFPLC